MNFKEVVDACESAIRKLQPIDRRRVVDYLTARYWRPAERLNPSPKPKRAERKRLLRRTQA